MTPQTGILSLPERRQSIDATLLPEIIELYLSTKLATGTITARTEKNYRNNLNPWFEYWRVCAGQHANLLSPEILAQALAWMRTDYRNVRERTPHETSIRHCWVRLRQVFNWAYKNNCTGTTNLAEWCPPLPEADPTAHFPTMQELAAILAQPAGESRLRDIAVIAFLVSTGARRYEAAHAEVKTLTFATPLTNIAPGADHSGWLVLRKVKGDAEGRGPGRPACFCSTCGLLLKCYLRSVDRREGKLFDMSDSAICQMVDKHAHAAGVPLVSPHGFRRMLADYWDEVHGIGGRAALKKQLGHAIAAGDVTERHYISRNQRRVAREIGKWHVSPLALIPLDWTRFPVHIEGGEG